MASRISSTNASHATKAISQWLMVLGLCFSLNGFMTAAQAQTPAKKSSQKKPEPVTLNFTNADIDAVAKTLASLSGHNVVVDPRVKGTITLTSTVPVAPSQALRLFAAQLRTQGYSLVESAGLYLVVPEADAKLQSGGVSAGAVPASNGQIVTQIFQLNHENANNLVPILRRLRRQPATLGTHRSGTRCGQCHGRGSGSLEARLGHRPGAHVAAIIGIGRCQ